MNHFQAPARRLQKQRVCRHIRGLTKVLTMTARQFDCAQVRKCWKNSAILTISYHITVWGSDNVPRGSAFNLRLSMRCAELLLLVAESRHCWMAVGVRTVPVPHGPDGSVSRFPYPCRSVRAFFTYVWCLGQGRPTCCLSVFYSKKPTIPITVWLRGSLYTSPKKGSTLRNDS